MKGGPFLFLSLFSLFSSLVILFKVVSNFFLCLLLILPIKVFRQPPSVTESSLETVLFGSTAPCQLGVVECRLCVHLQANGQSCLTVSIRVCAPAHDVPRLRSGEDEAMRTLALDDFYYSPPYYYYFFKDLFLHA